MYLEFRTFEKLIQDPKSITCPAVQGVASTAHLPNKKHSQIHLPVGALDIQPQSCNLTCLVYQRLPQLVAVTAISVSKWLLHFVVFFRNKKHATSDDHDVCQANSETDFLALCLYVLLCTFTFCGH